MLQITRTFAPKDILQLGSTRLLVVEAKPNEIIIPFSVVWYYQRGTISYNTFVTATELIYDTTAATVLTQTYALSQPASKIEYWLNISGIDVSLLAGKSLKIRHNGMSPAGGNGLLEVTVVYHAVNV